MYRSRDVSTLLCERIIDCGRALVDRNLTQNTYGNVSARVPSDPETFAITPSSIPYESISADQLPVLTLDGKICQGTGIPSTETIVHRIVYANRDDLDALIHTHSPFATVFACLGRSIRPYHNALAVAGGEIDVCAYATNGTEQLGENTLAAMTDRRAVLLANHGVLAGGETLEDALTVAETVEFCARMQYFAQLLGDPDPVSDDDLAALSAYFRRRGATDRETDEPVASSRIQDP